VRRVEVQSVFCAIFVCYFCFFFFSSRRRHTRFSRDWSSDVCSSDLRLAEAIARARDAVVLTGAGMSTESGIPDFRSSTGLWRNIDPRRVATVEAMETNPDLFRRFYGERLRNLADVRPHAGHYVLAEW